MITTYIPTPQDELWRLEGLITKRAPFFVGNPAPWVTFRDPTPGNNRGAQPVPTPLGVHVGVVVNVLALSQVNGNESYVATLQESPDGVEWNNCGVTWPLTSAGKVCIGAYVGNDPYVRYVRLYMAMGGTNPSITYEAWLNLYI